MRTKYAKKSTVVQVNRRLVVREQVGEDKSIFECDINQPYFAQALRSGSIRLFDATIDERGYEMPFIATWGNDLKTWFPQTSGIYVKRFNCSRDLRPANVRDWDLGFGDISSPQNTKAAIHRSYLDTLKKAPQLEPFLKIIKTPCVFCKDAPTHPGGSWIEIAVSDLPAPSDEKSLSRIYM